jgi:hypothetical protein
MKGYSLGILFLLLSLQYAFTQKGKCNLQPDPFNEKITRSYIWPSVNEKFLYLGLIDETVRVELYNEYYGSFIKTIPKGSEVLLKLENGEIIKSSLIEDSSPITVGTDVSSTSRYFYVIELNRDIISKILTSPIVLIRYPSPAGGTEDFGAKDVHKKYLKAISSGVTCILSQ